TISTHRGAVNSTINFLPAFASHISDEGRDPWRADAELKKPGIKCQTDTNPPPHDLVHGSAVARPASRRTRCTHQTDGAGRLRSSGSAVRWRGGRSHRLLAQGGWAADSARCRAARRAGAA